MNPIDETIQKRKQENYEKAWKDLMQALDSFRKLDNEQKNMFMHDMIQVAGLERLYAFLKKYLDEMDGTSK